MSVTHTMSASPLTRAMLTLVERRGFTPLHLSCRNHRSRAMRDLLTRCPTAATIRARLYGLPLHCAIMADFIEAVSSLLSVFSDGVRVPLPIGGMRQLPLHLASHVGSVEIIRELLSLWPESIHQVDDNKCLPIHCALRGPVPYVSASFRSLRLPALQVLIAAWPEGVREFNTFGCSPLDEGFCTLGGSDGGELNHRPILDALISAWPTCFSSRNHEGQVMLHRIVGIPRMPLAAVKEAITAWPEGLRCRDDDGDLPLMTAIRRDADVAIIQCLLEAWPDSVRETNHAGEIALHCCGFRTEAVVSDMLVAAWPDSVACRDLNGTLPRRRAQR